MKREVDVATVKSVLSQEVKVEDLKGNEILAFYRAVFKVLKDDTFNPESILVESPTNKRKERNVPSKEPKVYLAINDERVYNAEFKDKWLSEHRTIKGEPYKDETKRVAISMFGKIGHLEERYDKDVYDFSAIEFEDVLSELGATTLRSIQNSVSKIEQYINFAIEEGKLNNPENGNVASLYSSRDKLTNFIDIKAIEGMFFSKREIDTTSDYAINAQDGVILNLLFDGVSHKNKFIELTSVTIKHVDFDEMVINIPQLETINEDTGEIQTLPERQVPISEHTAKMINRAMKDDKYISLKGDSGRKYKIAESDYILRGLRNNDQIKWETIQQRILRISEVIGHEYLNATNIVYSGQIHYARELIKEGATVEEACRTIIKRFNIGDNDSAYFYLKSRIEKSN